MNGQKLKPCECVDPELIIWT